MVIIAPINMATTPEPAPSARLMATSTRSATNNRMFLVIYAKAKKINSKPTPIIKPPLTSPWAPKCESNSLTQVAGSFTAAFRGLLNSAPDEPMTLSVSHEAVDER